MPKLILIRHGQSLWNAENRFTGWRDIELSELGREQARAAGQLLQREEIRLGAAFTSDLRRAQETLEIILRELNQNPPVQKNQALNERDYGDLTGQNKDEAREKFGIEQVEKWRRGFADQPPGGESLAMTIDRVLPYFELKILPELRAGKNVLIAAHGNSLRALTKQLENLSPEEIVKVEFGTGEPVIYELGDAGEIISKRELK